MNIKNLFWTVFLGYFLISFIYRIIKRLLLIRKLGLYGYGYSDNKIIDKDSVSIFRDIPCNGDIYYAYLLIKLNKFGNDDTDLLRAIILKWVKEKKIVLRNIKDEKFDRNIRVIDLNINCKFNNDFERKLFGMMYEASENGILETEEFYDWAKNYDMRFLGLFAKLESEMINSLKKKTHIYHRITRKECKYRYVMEDKIYQDSLELYGFKKYLEEFSLMDKKEIRELHLWNDYLMFAILFGMGDKISRQLKDLYPDMEELDMYDLL